MIEDTEIRAFLQAEYPRLVNAVAFVTGDLGAAEDAVQEALLKAWERSERGEEIESLTAWVTTVALNQARSGFRRVMAERRARSRLGHEAVGGTPAGDRIDVERALSTLPRRQREAVVLRYYLQLDTREVAAVLGVNEGTIKSTLFRARAALADMLNIKEITDTEEANDRGTG